eukprot:comp18616_c0_seq1/m.33610 comp18616_c0_seq1/g.33610  ORF comp18616_c0_seq1/g.33610 comp18616_c0_seq1/m.33610 type:complete len:334 (+) comp18616_c0_seq1:79-1080(+)
MVASIRTVRRRAVGLWGIVRISSVARGRMAAACAAAGRAGMLCRSSDGGRGSSGGGSGGGGGSGSRGRCGLAGGRGDHVGGVSAAGRVEFLDDSVEKVLRFSVIACREEAADVVDLVRARLEIVLEDDPGPAGLAWRRGGAAAVCEVAQRVLRGLVGQIVVPVDLDVGDGDAARERGQVLDKVSEGLVLLALDKRHAERKGVLCVLVHKLRLKREMQAADAVLGRRMEADRLELVHFAVEAKMRAGLHLDREPLAVVHRNNRRRLVVEAQHRQRRVALHGQNIDRRLLARLAALGIPLVQLAPGSWAGFVAAVRPRGLWRRPGRSGLGGVSLQ